MNRPGHLPDFANPPVNEVVLGIQFAPAPSFTAVNVRDVWKLFQAEFPRVEQHPLLEPVFETFGAINPAPSVQLRVGPPSIGSRMWFLSDDSNRLLQFQHDRFLTNWRKTKSEQEYPHYERISADFESNSNLLDEYMRKEFNHPITVNQAEISYINIIDVMTFSEVGKWISLHAPTVLDIEAASSLFSERIADENGKPHARLMTEIQSVISSDAKKKAMRLSLTFRGAVPHGDIRSALNFLNFGRERIVTHFAQITTEEAHEKWGRTQ